MPAKYLEIADGPGKGGGYRLLGSEIIIGRAEDCDIRLSEVRGVSRHHCRITVTPDAVQVHDLDSQNGIFVNGRKCAEAALAPGGKLQIGIITFVLREENTPPVGLTPVTAAAAPLAPPPGLPAEMADSTLAEAQEIFTAAGRSSRRLLFNLLALVALIFAGLYLLHLTSISRRSPRNFIIVKAAEEKAVNLSARADYAECHDKRGGRHIVLVSPYKGLLAECLTDKVFDSNPNLPRRKTVVIKGDQQGEGWIRMFAADKTPAGRRRVICRGIKPRAFSENIDPKSARKLAQITQTEAEILAKDGRLYDSWRKYRLAEELHLAANDHHGINTCRERSTAQRQALRSQLVRIFNDALGKAFPADSRTARADFTGAALLLDQAKILLPDPASIDRQVIENWQLLINARRPQPQKPRE